MDKRTIRCIALDLLRFLAVAGLLGWLLAQPLRSAVERWRNRPRPGMQVCQQYVDKENDGPNAANPQLDTVLSLPAQVNYLLYLPPDYEASRKWPLVVYLHGSGQRGNNVNVLRRAGPPKQVEQGKRFNFILVSPQCLAGTWWNGELIVDLIEHVSRSLSVDRDRVYLTGCSMGGTGTWLAASCDPARFAAIAPLCGNSLLSRADRLTNVPIWAFHGAKDQTAPLKMSVTMVEAVRKHGGHVKFTVYLDLGHGICEETYERQPLFEWLLAHRRGQPGAYSKSELADSARCLTVK